MIKFIGKKIKNKKGFTLIELIVVIAILGILAGVAVPRLTGFQESAREKADISNAKMIANTVQILIAEGKIPAGTSTAVSYTLTGVPTAGTDLEDIYIALGSKWPVPQAAAATGTKQYVVTVSANDVITLTAGGVNIYPTAAGGYID